MNLKEQFLNKVLEEFPDLSKNKFTQEYQNKDEVKFANNDYKNFPKNIKILIDFMNSNEFIEFLQNITSINEKLISDRELNGGGLHEIKTGGYLKVHTDLKCQISFRNGTASLSTTKILNDRKMRPLQIDF